jgi:hypothetical protein
MVKINYEFWDYHQIRNAKLLLAWLDQECFTGLITFLLWSE